LPEQQICFSQISYLILNKNEYNVKGTQCLINNLTQIIILTGDYREKSLSRKHKSANIWAPAVKNS